MWFEISKNRLIVFIPALYPLCIVNFVKIILSKLPTITLNKISILHILQCGAIRRRRRDGIIRPIFRCLQWIQSMTSSITFQMIPCHSISVMSFGCVNCVLHHRNHVRSITAPHSRSIGRHHHDHLLHQTISHKSTGLFI